MKRFHVHLSVSELDRNIEFYSQLFGQSPDRQEADYAKWMLDDPRINFAISTRGSQSGLDHFGFQVDSPEELAGIRERAEAAAGEDVFDQGESQCCYAHSDKHWTVDPQGLGWEHFQTLSTAVRYGDDVATADGACCRPEAKAGEAVQAGGSCC